MKVNVQEQDKNILLAISISGFLFSMFTIIAQPSQGICKPRGKVGYWTKGQMEDNSPFWFILRNTLSSITLKWKWASLRSKINKSSENSNFMMKIYPPYNTVGLHLLRNCWRIPQQSRLHLTSCKARKQSFVTSLFPPSYFVFHCFVLIPLCFIWLLKPECLAFGNKSLWANILCALESKGFTLVCTANCAPFWSPEPVLKLESQELGQDCTLPGGLHWADPYLLVFVPLFSVRQRSCRELWFLITSIANSMSTLARCQCAQDLKLTIPDQCLRGAALNFNNTIKFLEYEIYPDCRCCTFCTFSLWGYPHTEPEHSVPVSA